MLILMDGFDHYNNQTAAGYKGWQYSDNVGVGFIHVFYGSGGRVNGQCITMHNENNVVTQHYRKPLPVTATTVIVGCAFNLQGPHQGGGSDIPSTQLLRLLDTGANQIWGFAINSLGTMSVSGPWGTTTGTALFVGHTWFHVEVKIVIAGASGQLSTQVNGAPDIAATTVNAGTTPAQFIEFGLNQNDYVYFADDLYVCDGTGAHNNNFLGDRHIDTLYPTADGFYQAWTPDTGTAHYSRVNETNFDADSSYVSTPTVGAIDSYQMSDVSVLSADIRGLQVNMFARKDDAGLRQAASLLRIAGADYFAPTQTMATGYVDYTQMYEQNPATSADWTVSDVNNIEAGEKVIT